MPYLYGLIVRMFDRSYAVTRLKSSNLLLVLVDSAGGDSCSRNCGDFTSLPFEPVENILFTYTFVLRTHQQHDSDWFSSLQHPRFTTFSIELP